MVNQAPEVLAALQKLRRYCSYQERTPQEVRKKLQSLGITTASSIDYIMERLQEENFLNEVRYATTFVRSKFSYHKWGRRKIGQALQAKQFDTVLIQESLAKIDAEAYWTTLLTLLKKKKSTLATIPATLAQTKVRNYLRQKGYEDSLIQQAIQAHW